MIRTLVHQNDAVSGIFSMGTIENAIMLKTYLLNFLLNKIMVTIITNKSLCLHVSNSDYVNYRCHKSKSVCANLNKQLITWSTLWFTDATDLSTMKSKFLMQNSILGKNWLGSIPTFGQLKIAIILISLQSSKWWNLCAHKRYHS